MPPVLLLDCYSLLFRAHHALPPMNTKAGAPTAALYGFSALLVKLLRERAPSHIAFAVDAPGPSFRRDTYPAYKAGRPATPDDLAAQLTRLPALLDATGAPTWSAPGLEADDILATLAAEVAAAGERALVVSGDRDLLQLAAPAVDILFVGRRGRDHVLYDVAAVEARFGVAPTQLPTYVALTGDPSDNLPKVPGVGAKTAARWIHDHGDIDGILAAAATLRPPRARAALLARADQLRTSERLARLCTDVPLPDEPHWAAVTADTIAGLRAAFEELEFQSLLPRLDALGAA